MACQISVLCNVVLVLVILAMLGLHVQDRRWASAARTMIDSMDVNLSATRTVLTSKRRDAQLAEDRARRNQERSVRFRNELIRLYALHEFCIIGSADAMQRVDDWDRLPTAEQLGWMQMGRDFVERNYGPWIG